MWEKALKSSVNKPIGDSNRKGIVCEVVVIIRQCMKVTQISIKLLLS